MGKIKKGILGGILWQSRDSKLVGQQVRGQWFLNVLD
jgi:hypothetical protein